MDWDCYSPSWIEEGESEGELPTVHIEDATTQLSSFAGRLSADTRERLAVDDIVHLLTDYASITSVVNSGMQGQIENLPGMIPSLARAMDESSMRLNSLTGAAVSVRRP